MLPRTQPYDLHRLKTRRSLRLPQGFLAHILTPLLRRSAEEGKAEDAMEEGTPTATPAPAAVRPGAAVGPAVDDDEERLLLTAPSSSLAAFTAAAPADADVRVRAGSAGPEGASEEGEEVVVAVDDGYAERDAAGEAGRLDGPDAVTEVEGAETRCVRLVASRASQVFSRVSWDDYWSMTGVEGVCLQTGMDGEWPGCCANQSQAY